MGERVAGSIVLFMMMGMGQPSAGPLSASVPDPGPASFWSDEQQPPPAARGRRGLGPGAEGLTARALERYFDDYEMLQAQRALGLDSEQFIVPGQRLRRLQNIRRRHENDRRRLMNALRTALGTGGAAVDEGAVATALKALDDARFRQTQERRRALQSFDAVLTVPQRAEYRLFQERFERQKLDLLSRARQGRRGGQPPGGRLMPR